MNPATRQSVAAHLDAGRPEQARRLLLQALQRAPGDADALNLMAVAQSRLGLAEQAAASARLAAQAAPRSLPVRLNLANLLLLANREEEAAQAFRAAADLDPHNPEAAAGLAAALAAGRRFAGAAAAATAALAHHPGHVRLSMEAAGALLNCGRAAEALAVLEAAQRHARDLPILQMRRAAAMLYAPGFTAGAVAEAHRDFGRLLRPFVPAPPADAPPPRPRAGGKLRVGILSSDLRAHAVAEFLLPLLTRLDRARSELVCYHDAAVSDAVTAQIKPLAQQWTPTAALPDEALAARIRADSLDVLLELGGFTSRPRPVTLALSPAPRVVSWLGYPGTLGIPGVHARLVDSLTDPPGTAEPLHTEALVRLDPCFLCYTPRAAPAAPTPRGHTVFGSFNTLQKVNDPLLALWARVLARVPGSRLLIKSGGLEEPALAGQVRARAAAQGIDPARLDLLGYLPTAAAHLAAYAGVDIALDTFPYHGTTTTCEALSMGVPVISLVGGAHVSRVGLSLLTAAGRPQWAAKDEEAYTAAAATLAADRSALAALRAQLPAQVRASTLCDADAFAARFAAALEALAANATA